MTTSPGTYRITIPDWLATNCAKAPHGKAWLDRLPELPNKVIDLVERLRDGRIQVEWKSQEIDKLRNEVRLSNQRTVLAVIGSSFVICGAVIYGLDGYSPMMLGGAPWLTWMFGGVGLCLLIFSMGD